MNTEIPLKQWVMEQSIRERSKPATVYDRLHDGKYGVPSLRRINQRVVFIDSGFRPARLLTEPLQGEIRVSQWVVREAIRTGLSQRCIWNRYFRSKYALKLRKVNAGVIFVQEVKAVE